MTGSIQPRRVTLYSPAEVSLILSGDNDLPKFWAPSFIRMQNFKVVRSKLLTALAVTNKAVNEKKNCPHCLIPKVPAISTQKCGDKVTNGTFHLPDTPLLQ